MKSILKNIVHKKSGQSANGAYEIFSVEFENGDKGDVFDKTNPSKYTVGTEYEYDLSPNGQYAAKITIKGNKQFQKGRDTSKETALSCAVSLVTSGKVPIEKLEETFKKLLGWL